ncbi:hypothetical protein [Pseudoxanthomonas sp. PXM02]|uniref:hypothetical protein n=1 Tax=Pseudoxanthomonas sp. PXM02 TaxID=2769294 RepID=UPI00177D808D|nr:hypothetical protein [Pseudoxanthomonas sp. PXM02]MBD9480751.1 hypothetical protein [Pseudoxanthomonas sp. PXM02]
MSLLRFFILPACLVMGLPSAHAQVVVLAHPESGAYVVSSSRKEPMRWALQEARRKQPAGGWTPLLRSTLPGHGAMFCIRPKNAPATEFFVVEGRATSADAITESRAQANQAAARAKTTSYICGTWNNTNRFPLDAVPDPAEP